MCKEENILITLRKLESGYAEMVEAASTKSIYEYLCAVPDGVIAMSGLNPGFVETSLNLGVLKLTEAGLEADYALRSSIEQSKFFLRDRVDMITRAFGGTCEFSGDYPGWAYRVDSPLRELMLRIFKEKYGKEPVVEAIHAGLECGFFLDKIPQLDCVSMGPDMKDIHTTEEKLSISSTERVWKFLVEYLKQAK